MAIQQQVTIGVIGNGFVGSAVRFGFSPGTGCDATVRIYDKDSSKSVDTIEDTVNKSEFIFLSVPTPSNKDGSMNLDIVKRALQDISDINERDDNIVLLRSTVTPGTTRKLQEQFDNLRIVFNPEFLTERSAKYDFINQSRVILGGTEGVDKTAELFRWRFGESIPIIETTWETAELIKYMCNCFFATKVSFMNEMYLIANEVNADWGKAIEGFTLDNRVGSSHVNVPGHDGQFGFGGSCFPKDIQALIKFSKDLNIDAKVIQATWETNLKVRPERDWEKLKGRAVINKEMD